MAGENIAANYGDMGSAVTQFNAKYSEFEQALSQINNVIQQLGATWKGTGYESFQAVSNEWHTKVVSLNNTLNEISNNVNRGSGTYQETDQGVAQTFRNVGFGR